MKKTLFAVILFISFIEQPYAQCNFTATAFPNDLILCPESTDTLWTEEYDNYQWFKDNMPIDGATERFYVVEQYRDAGSNFKVAGTLNGCTDTSENVLVDGWMFAPPVVFHEGDLGWTDINGNTHLCKGDTLILYLFEFPYNTNIQWYRNGSILLNDTTNSLKVIQSGSYTVSGSPATCPDWTAHLGVSIDVFVHDPVVPSITQINEKLQSTLASTYQWYLNGNEIKDAINQEYAPTASGTYTVATTDNNNCSAVSDEFNFNYLGIDKNSVNMIKIYPNPATDLVTVNLTTKEQMSTIILTDILGEIVYTNDRLNQQTSITIPVSSLSEGLYQLKIRTVNENLYTQKLIITN